MRLKIEGALIRCIVAVLAKTCLEKFTPKVHRMSYNFIYFQQKSLVRHISQTIRRIEKHFFLLEVHLIEDIFVFCENRNFYILIRSNVNGNLKSVKLVCPKFSTVLMFVSI